jgi:hypothetical protein
LPRPRISPHNSLQSHGAFVTKPLKTRFPSSLNFEVEYLYSTEIDKALWRSRQAIKVHFALPVIHRDFWSKRAIRSSVCRENSGSSLFAGRAVFAPAPSERLRSTKELASSSMSKCGVETKSKATVQKLGYAFRTGPVI